MTDPAAAAARTAAVILAPDFGPNLPAEVEAALHTSGAREQRPGTYDPVAIAALGVGAASLIVSIAQLAWSIVSDQRKHTPEPPPTSVARQVRIILHDQDIALPSGFERITEIVAAEIIRQASPLGEPGG